MRPVSIPSTIAGWPLTFYSGLRHVAAAAATLRMTTPNTINIVVCIQPQAIWSQKDNRKDRHRQMTHRIQKWRGRRYHRLLTRVPIDDGVGQRVSNRRIRPRERSHRGSVDARLRGFELVYLTPCILLATKRVRIRVGRILS